MAFIHLYTDATERKWREKSGEQAEEKTKKVNID